MDAVSHDRAAGGDEEEKTAMEAQRGLVYGSKVWSGEEERKVGCAPEEPPSPEGGELVYGTRKWSWGEERKVMGS